MNKSVKRIACLLLSALTVFPMISCGDEEGGELQETRPVRFATDALDGNFNPFFATSAPDSEMASMTQIGMLTTDGAGNIACGENQPTVVLSYTENDQIYDDEGQQYTEYSFVIKNGIKFSDGVDLTIKDVLFNLYVYLDPAYMGSATLYSTDIVGLKAYQTQEEDADNSTTNFNERFEAEADDRLSRLAKYLLGESQNLTAEQTETIKKDIETTKKLFREEIEKDWTACQGQLESYKDDHSFTEDWQVYYWNEGIITPWVNDGRVQMQVLLDDNGDYILDENGQKKYKYITNITPASGVYYEVGVAGSDDKQLIEYKGENNDKNQAIIEGIKALSADEQQAYAIQSVYDYYINAELGEPESELNKNGMAEILGWATGDNLYNEFVGDARTTWFESRDMAVETITGITTTKTTVNGESHDVLKIKIKGVDPKAIYNFAFAVAPMHYYSGEFEKKDYVKQAMEDTTGTKFGVKFADKDFFSSVLQDTEKNKKPVGAGVYKVSNQKGDETNVSGNDFYSNNWVYFVRNEYFHTVGGDAIQNAKIKYLRYKVVNSDKLLQALEAGDIDIGEPNATADNINAIEEAPHLEGITVATNGYGYVGVNPKFVPDIEVRQAIMYALDVNMCISYYTQKYASVLTRSMSKESWIWDYLPSTEYQDLYEEYYPTERNAAKIRALVESAGWKEGGDGVYVKGNERLKLTFTLAGSTTDHPAYKMFRDAENFLENCGFDITVTTDIQALKKLATGQLQVWAAAWSSTIDPDMYQVYHKDSNATSTNNWGYPTIKNGTQEQFGDEKKIIDELSILIEQGRETTDKATRAKTYAQALDKVMELAVELPTYQRKDCVCYNVNLIKESSLNQDPSPFSGVIDRIWELDYN